MDRPTKITFGEMRASGALGVVVYCCRLHLQPLTGAER